VDVSEARSFLAQHHRTVMATRRRDGRVQMSPVVSAIDDAGRVMVSSRQAAAKTKNLRRDPWTSLCVLNDGFFGEWARVDGEVTVVDLPDAMELLVDYYRRLSGDHPDWDDYRAAMEREGRVMLLVTITDAGPSTGG
jgi:PPOX class probable F420-dependent enzyme